MSYAIVKVGGKQYRVEEGSSILGDRMQANEGDKVDLQPLLFADGDKSVIDAGDLGRVKIQAVVAGHEKGGAYCVRFTDQCTEAAFRARWLKGAWRPLGASWSVGTCSGCPGPGPDLTRSTLQGRSCGVVRHAG